MADSASIEEKPPSPADPKAFTDIIVGAVLARCVGAVADLHIADVLGDSAETAEQLAAKVGANAATLGRVMRFIAAYGVFESVDGAYKHNALSKLLRSDHPMSTGAFMRISTDAWPLLGAIDHSLRTGRPAAEKAVGGDYWSYLASHADVARRFDEGMISKGFSQIASLMPVYDFSAFRSIVDVGGGRGHFIKTILAAYPQISGALFDRPQVIDTLEQPADPRLKLQAGDFFTDDVPPCDAILLMNILHDWNDEECVAILKNLRRQARPATKLLIAEAPIPEVEGPNPILMTDVVMMTYATGRERKLTEYKALFDASGWHLDRVVDSGTGMAILESSVM